MVAFKAGAVRQSPTRYTTGLNSPGSISKLALPSEVLSSESDPAECAQALNEFLSNSIRAVSRIKQLARPTSVSAKTRKELDDINSRIAAVLQVQEDDSANANLVDREELAILQDTIVTVLAEYKKTCQARKNVLAAVDHGLVKLGAELRREDEVDVEDGEEDVVGRPASGPAHEVIINNLQRNHAQLRKLHEQELTMLQTHIQSM